MSDVTNMTPTNIFASNTFDILKMNGVEEPLLNVNNLASVDLEESYFISAVNFVNEQDAYISETKAKLFRSISEAATTEVVLESFSDFFVVIKDIIDKFLKFMKSLFIRFINTLMSIIQSDKYILKNKKKFREFRDGSDTFYFDGYEYTFKPNIPAPHAIQSFDATLFNGLVSNADGDLTVESVKNSIANLDIEADCDKFRARVLDRGDNEILDPTDFSEELFKEFRNDDTETTEIEVTSSVVMNSLRRFEEYNKTKKDVERTLKAIEREYNAVKKQVEEVSKRNGDLNAAAFMDRLPTDYKGNIRKIGGTAVTNSGVVMGSEIMIQLDFFVQAKANLITEYSNIHSLAFGAKLDALKECFRQDRALLYRALNKIDRTDGMREVK